MRAETRVFRTGSLEYEVPPSARECASRPPDGEDPCGFGHESMLNSRFENRFYDILRFSEDREPINGQVI